MGKITASPKEVTNRKYFGSQNLIDICITLPQENLKMFRVEELENVAFKFKKIVLFLLLENKKMVKYF